MNRVPFDPAGAGTVTDPVFGRDISFFLFDLGSCASSRRPLIGLVVASLVVAGARYLVGGARPAAPSSARRSGSISASSPGCS